MHKRKLMFGILIYGLSLGSLEAQSWDHAKGVGVQFSYFKFLGDVTDRAAPGNWAGLTLKYGVSRYTLLELQGNYGNFKPSKLGSSYKKDSLSPYRTFLFPMQLNLKITPSTRFIKPYLLVGAGMMFWDLRKIDDPDAGFWSDPKFRWGAHVSGFRKNMYVQEGVGLEVFINSHFSVDVAATFSSLLLMKNDNVGYGDVNSQVLEGRISLSYYWGSYGDKDKDGIPDRKDGDPERPEDFDGFQDHDGLPDYDNDNDSFFDAFDKAPNDPEDFDGFQDTDGIPDPDNDNDGIPDADDKCPMLAEDMDQFQDEDGCPETDNDEDGIADADDQCQGEKEDRDGFQDFDGCPDPDNDGDGIPDEQDKCPLEAEVVNEFEDEDGCPDEKPVEEPTFGLQTTGAKLVLQNIQFASGRAELSSASFQPLDEIAAGLIARPEIELEIRGYTDSVGDDAFNQRLSERRARSLYNYLIMKGVAASRLRAVGFGERYPVALNDTPQGRAMNRRIEFLRVK